MSLIFGDKTLQGLVQPDLAGTAGLPGGFFVGSPDIDGDHGLACFSGGLKRGIVSQAQILADPVNAGCRFFFLGFFLQIYLFFMPVLIYEHKIR